MEYCDNQGYENLTSIKAKQNQCSLRDLLGESKEYQQQETTRRVKPGKRNCYVKVSS